MPRLIEKSYVQVRRKTVKPNCEKCKLRNRAEKNLIPCWPEFGDGTPGGVRDGKLIRGKWLKPKTVTRCNALPQLMGRRFVL